MKNTIFQSGIDLFSPARLIWQKIDTNRMDRLIPQANDSTKENEPIPKLEEHIKSLKKKEKKVTAEELKAMRNEFSNVNFINDLSNEDLTYIIDTLKTSVENTYNLHSRWVQAENQTDAETQWKTDPNIIEREVDGKKVYGRYEWAKKTEGSKEKFAYLRSYGDTFLLQIALKKLGFDPGTIDGKWGTNTEEALKKFQSEVMEMETPDGKFGPKTFSSLESALNGKMTLAKEPIASDTGVGTETVIEQDKSKKELTENEKASLLSQQKETNQLLFDNSINYIKEFTLNPADIIGSIQQLFTLKKQYSNAFTNPINAKKNIAGDTINDLMTGSNFTGQYKLLGKNIAKQLTLKNYQVEFNDTMDQNKNIKNFIKNPDTITAPQFTFSVKEDDNVVAYILLLPSSKNGIQIRTNLYIDKKIVYHTNPTDTQTNLEMLTIDNFTVPIDQDSLKQLNHNIGEVIKKEKDAEEE